MTPDADNGEDPGVVDVLPGLARVAAGIWLRTAAWGVGSSIRISARLARAATSPDEAALFVDDVRAGLRTYARELLGIADLDDRVRQLMPSSSASSARGQHTSRRQDASALREQGAELLRESADVTSEDGAHPAYERILSELAPDEGRVLRLLATHGAQPVIDVRAANLIGVGSQLVARQLNMIGAEAGCRFVERVPAYLNNLDRLGLIWFSDDPLDDPLRYQVLEAQPEPLDAIRRAGRAKTDHRTVELTPFGQDFCAVCLPLEAPERAALSEGSGSDAS